MSVQPTVVARFRAGVRAAIENTLVAPAIMEAMRYLDPVAIVPMPVLEARDPRSWHAMNLPGDEAIVFAYAGEPKVEAGPISRRDRQGYVCKFSIAICSGGWADPVEATYKAADIAEYLKGSPTLPPETPNLRTQIIATVEDRDLYLRFVDTVPTIAPHSMPAGGRFAIVQTWQTEEVRV